jgi:hypothetical protein
MGGGSDDPCANRLGSGPRGRRFKSCLPDSEGRDSSRETDGTRPSFFPDGALRTTGAPKSVTLGAEDAAIAAALARSPSPHTDEARLPDALPAFLEACGKLAAEAARRGDLRRAHELTELAARAAARD